MPTPTTPTAVRDALRTAIVALTPTTLPGDTFQHYALEKVFEQFAADDPSNCFRQFQLRYLQAEHAPVVVNGTLGRWRYAFELVVAYPRAHYKTIATPVLDLDQAIEEDTAKIIPVLRDYVDAAYVSELATFERDTPDDGPATFLRFGATFELWRTV